MEKQRRSEGVGRLHAARPQWLAIESDGEGVHIQCALADLLDADCVNRLRRSVTAALSPRVRRIELDLSRVEEADTKLLASLIVAVRRAKRCGVSLRIICSPQVEQLARLCRAEHVLNAGA